MLKKVQTQKIFKICENINALDKEDHSRVFCWRLQEWVHIEHCNCHWNNRVRANMEW